MSNKTDLESKRLPYEEWDFSMIPAELTDLAFFYEFSRQSQKIKNRVDDYRKLHPYFPKETWMGGPLCFDNALLEQLAPSEIDYINSLMPFFKFEAFLSVIDWLSYCPGFPDKPFSELTEEEYRNNRPVPVNTRGLDEWAGRGPDNYLHQLIPFVDKTFVEIADTPGVLKEYNSIHLIHFDWRKTDAELVRDFKDWMKMQRECFAITPTHAYARGLYNDPIPMPDKCKKKEKALEYLGVLRKQQACATWRQYMQTYCHSDADQRPEEKKVAAAGQLLAWFESQLQP